MDVCHVRRHQGRTFIRRRGGSPERVGAIRCRSGGFPSADWRRTATAAAASAPARNNFHRRPDEIVTATPFIIRTDPSATRAPRRIELMAPPLRPRSHFFFLFLLHFVASATPLEISTSPQKLRPRQQVFTEFLPGFTRFSWALASFSGFYRAFTEFYWVLPGFTGFYQVLLGFIGFLLFLLGFTGF